MLKVLHHLQLVIVDIRKGTMGLVGKRWLF